MLAIDGFPEKRDAPATPASTGVYRNMGIICCSTIQYTSIRESVDRVHAASVFLACLLPFSAALVHACNVVFNDYNPPPPPDQNASRLVDRDLLKRYKWVQKGWFTAVSACAARYN